MSYAYHLLIIRDNMNNLLHKINENLEIMYEHFKGLQGFTAKNLKKVSASFTNKKQNIANLSKNQQVTVPL